MVYDVLGRHSEDTSSPAKYGCLHLISCTGTLSIVAARTLLSSCIIIDHSYIVVEVAPFVRNQHAAFPHRHAPSPWGSAVVDMSFAVRVFRLMHNLQFMLSLVLSVVTPAAVLAQLLDQQHRVSCQGFYAGCKAELSELLFPLRLKFEELGRRQTLSTDKQRGDWHRDLRHRWDGSLVVFTPQHATDHAALLGLARLCSMLRYYSPLLACFMQFCSPLPTCLK